MVIWDSIDLSSHIKRQYRLIHELNLDTVEVHRRTNSEAGNFFAEDIEENVVKYTVKININPVKEDDVDRDLKKTVQRKHYECYSDPELYPTTGLDEEGNVVATPFEKFLEDDKVYYKSEYYKIGDDLANVALNNKPMLWQHFTIKVVE